MTLLRFDYEILPNLYDTNEARPHRVRSSCVLYDKQFRLEIQERNVDSETIRHYDITSHSLHFFCKEFEMKLLISLSNG